MGTDFLINFSTCFRIIYLNYKDRTPLIEKGQIGLLQELVLNEIAEVCGPLSVAFSFIIAFYGPNAALIGDIGNSYWQYIAVEDVEHTIKYLFLFFLIDSISLVLCTFLLWNVCKISMYKAYAALQVEFGLAFALFMSASLTGVSRLSSNISSYS